MRYKDNKVRNLHVSHAPLEVTYNPNYRRLCWRNLLVVVSCFATILLTEVCTDTRRTVDTLE